MCKTSKPGHSITAHAVFLLLYQRTWCCKFGKVSLFQIRLKRSKCVRNMDERQHLRKLAVSRRACAVVFSYITEVHIDLEMFWNTLPRLVGACLCNLYVRTLMEYNSVVWSSDLKWDIEAIEKVQRRFTKRLAALKKLSYGQRLKLVNLPSLELRRLHTESYCGAIKLYLVSLI